MAAKIAAAVRARRHLFVIARTDAAASEGLEWRRRPRAICISRRVRMRSFPEALTSDAMFREFAQRVKAPLLANMTEFGRTPSFSADASSRRWATAMVIWPVSALRVAAKAHEKLYAAAEARWRRPGRCSTQMQTREELYGTIGYADYEALDASIVKSTKPGQA